MSIKKIVLDWKGKQIPWFPEKTDRIQIPFQKETKLGKEIVIDKILEKDGKFGQPYLSAKLIGEVVRHGQDKKIFGMKYKAKKRNKRFWGHQESYTEIKITSVEG